MWAKQALKLGVRGGRPGVCFGEHLAWTKACSQPSFRPQILVKKVLLAFHLSLIYVSALDWLQSLAGRTRTLLASYCG